MFGTGRPGLGRTDQFRHIQRTDVGRNQVFATNFSISSTPCRNRPIQRMIWIPTITQPFVDADGPALDSQVLVVLVVFDLGSDDFQAVIAVDRLMVGPLGFEDRDIDVIRPKFHHRPAC